MAGENSGGRTVAGGTVYSIQEGRTVSGGTVYAVKEGRTIAGGTVYSIVMGEKTYTVTITGSGQKSSCYVTIGGTKYTSAAEITGLPEGTAIACYTQCGNTNYIVYIYLNGEVVAQGLLTAAEYEYVLKDNVTINMNKLGTGRYDIYIDEYNA